MARFELPKTRYTTVIYFTGMFNVLREVYNFTRAMALGMGVFITLFVVPVALILLLIFTLTGGSYG